MDLVTRKKLFIEEFEKISEEEKIARFEALLSKEINDEQPVANTINGNGITSASYKKRNQQALNSYQKGNIKTSQEMLKKYGFFER